MICVRMGRATKRPNWLAGLGEEVVQTLSYARADTMSRSELQSRFRRPLRGGGVCRGTPARAGDISSRPGSMRARAVREVAESRPTGSRRCTPEGRWSIVAVRLENSTHVVICITESGRCAWVRASSAPNGSSSRRTFSSIARARAMPTRCLQENTPEPTLQLTYPKLDYRRARWPSQQGTLHAARPRRR